jgi:hypothetical protein
MPKTGIDDYLAAGGTVAALKLMARPFNPEDLLSERLSRDDRLREAVGRLRAECRAMPAVKIGECSDLAVMRDFIRTAERSGKLVEDGVWVIRSARDGADGAQTSLGGWKNAVDRLEAAGRIRREFWGRAKDKPGAYVLLTPWGGGSALGEHNGGGNRGGRQEKETESSFSRETPLSKATFPTGVHVTRAPFSDEVPELRWPKVILKWDRVGRQRVLVSSEYVARLGKKRREIISYLLGHGIVDVAELREKYGAKSARLRDFRRRMLGPLEAEGIITLEGETAALTDAWREALEECRQRTGEIEDARRQAEKHAREKEAFRKAATDGHDTEPPTVGRERVREIVAERAAEDATRRIEEERKKVGITASVFLADTLAGISGIRWQELRDRWRERGGKPEGLRQAVRSGPFTFKREDVDGQLYVYRTEGLLRSVEERETPASVAVLHDLAIPPQSTEPLRERLNRYEQEIREERREERKPPPQRPPKITHRAYGEGVYQHGPACACEWCEEDPAPNYVQSFGGAS